MTLKEIVDDYIANCRVNAKRELRWFKMQKTLKGAVSTAALAKKPSGKRFDHQRRIPQNVLKLAEEKLLKNLKQIQSTKDFDELYNLLKELLSEIKGIGELYIYDTALRIGAYLGYEPDKIYLHAGTLEGAKKLRVNTKHGYILKKDLPSEFNKLLPREIEDCLCIYKDEF